jgi:hypothetical protein
MQCDELPIWCYNCCGSQFVDFSQFVIPCVPDRGNNINSGKEKDAVSLLMCTLSDLDPFP